MRPLTPPRGERANGNDRPVRPDASTGRMPLSYAQQQQWILHHLAADPAVGNLPVAVRLTGPLHRARLRSALTALVQRHDVLRARFGQAPAGPYQETAPAGPVPLPVEDLRGRSAPDPETALAAALRREAGRPFDLAAGRPLRARLLQLGTDEQVLCLTAHRLCLDERSTGLLLGELAGCYQAAAAATPAPGPQRGEPARTQRDRAPAERDRAPAVAPPSAVRHWERTLDGASPLELPTDRPRPAQPSGTGACVRHRISGLDLAATAFTGADPSMVALAGVATLFFRYSEEPDLVVGTDRSARSPAMTDLVGALTETVALRVDLRGDPTFAAVARHCQESVRTAREHGAAALAEARRRLGDLGRPLFRVAVNLRDPAGRQLDLPGLVTEPVDVDPPVARMDLVIDIATDQDGVLVTAEYATELFDQVRIERMMRHLETLLRAGTAAPERRLSELPLLTAGERARVLTDWQGPAVPYRRAPVYQQIREHALRAPGTVAVQLASEQLTYGELDRRSELLARRLRAQGVGHEQIVAVCLERGLDAIVAMVGVLRAGAAFAILDPDHPPRRLEFILDDTQARVVLTHAEILPRLPAATGWMPICLDRDWPAIERQPTGPPLAEWAGEHSLAYVLYTSGSTGQPKGALIEHGSLSNFVLWPAWLFDLRPGDRMLQHMALIFDFSEGEIFTGLTCGATLVMLPEPVRTSPEALGRLIADERITCVFGPPAVLNKVDLPPCPDLKYVVVGGDVCTGDLVSRWNTPGRRFINGYGPTEATVGCTAYECDHRTWTTQPPIGRAMPNRVNYILDREQQPCPVGVPGELYIGGVGLARGYLNRRGLTAQRFLPNPFRTGERMYRTGDLCGWTEDGQIQFLGRIDTQVKVNGLRVELEEIEAALTAHPSVQHAAVTPRADWSGAMRLVAHVVPGAGQVDSAALRAHLAELLPTYLVPSQFVRLETLPLTRVGKVDRAALRDGDDQAGTQRSFRPPRTPLERQAAAVLAALLDLPRVGVEDTFFALGGTSLQLVTLTEQLNQSFGVSLRAGDVYAAATVAEIARLITAGRGAPPASTTPAPDALALLAEVELMSDDEVSQLSPRGQA